MDDSIDGKAIQWLGVRWEGPEDGALFVLDCEAKVIAVSRIGAVQAIDPFSNNRHLRNAIKVEYIAGTGTGYFRTEIAIFSYRNNSIKRLYQALRNGRRLHVREEEAQE